MGNHRASGRAQVRPLRTSASTHRDAVQAGVVKVGVLGALATATIAVPLASAAASGQDQALPLAEQPAAVAADAPVLAEPASTEPVQIAALPEVRVAEDSASRSEERAVEPAVGDAGQAVTVSAESGEPVQIAAADAATPLTVEAAPKPVVTESADGTTVVTGGSAAPSAEGYLQPVQAPITSGYGMRVHPVLGYSKMHDGVDFAASCGTDVKAPADGTVIAVEYNGASGNRVKIDHGNGVITGYFHLSSFGTTVGATVQQGDVIGQVGSTGRSTGCHLHLVKMDAAGSYSDPMSLFG